MLAFDTLPSLIIIMIIIGALTVRPARAQDLDQDKSGAKLFATTCTDCHRSPRGLAKGSAGRCHPFCSSTTPPAPPRRMRSPPICSRLMPLEPSRSLPPARRSRRR
jgi:hypothetical protein